MMQIIMVLFFNIIQIKSSDASYYKKEFSLRVKCFFNSFVLLRCLKLHEEQLSIFP
jgi:hypothetical protein